MGQVSLREHQFSPVIIIPPVLHTDSFIHHRRYEHLSIECRQITILFVRLYAMCINLLKPTGHVMLQQFNIQQLYVLPTLYLCVLYLSENKQRLVPLTA